MAGLPLTSGVATLDGISPALAALAGLASFVSPCVLPLVPAYLAYLGARAGLPAISTGASGVASAGVVSAAAVDGRSSTPVVAAGIGFVAGLSLVFIAVFYLFTILLEPVRSVVPVVAGVFVIVLALHIAGVIRLPFLSREYRLMTRAPDTGGVAGGFLLGMGFASGWTPCIGVTLGAVLSSAVTSGTTAQGLALMLAYCAGLGVPFVVLAFAVERARPLVRLVNEHRRAIDLASAAVLVVMGGLLLTNHLTVLSSGMAQLIPWWPNPAL